MVWHFCLAVGLSFILRFSRLARICLLRSVVPEGRVTLYLPSCSGSTRLAGFAGGETFALATTGALTFGDTGRATGWTTSVVST